MSPMSVFFTGNTIYGAGCRITSLVVAQDAGNKTQSLDRFGPSGGGNTLHPVCGCVYLMLGYGEVCFVEGFCAMYCYGIGSWFWGVPLLPLYTRRAGFH